MNILISSGFIETELESFRENQYPRVLASGGHSVTVVGSNQSWIWRFNRAGTPETCPDKNDFLFQKKYNYSIIRLNPYIRFGDFIILPVPYSEIKKADVIHLIEFRQGNAVLVAMVAKFLGKKVIYDHEQRGNRDYTIFHKLDSIFRCILIGIGSMFVDVVRHTVIANREHYLKYCWKKPKKIVLAPLAADGSVFYYNEQIRLNERKKLNIDALENVAVVSGKLNSIKKSTSAINALLHMGFTVLVAGVLDKRIQNEKCFSSNKVVLLGNLPAIKLNEIYNIADIAVFTTFTVSYWEALASGLAVAVPDTRFSRGIMPPDITLFFGSEEMFEVVEENYKKDYDLYGELISKLQKFNFKNKRCNRPFYTWNGYEKKLLETYVA